MEQKRLESFLKINVQEFHLRRASRGRGRGGGRGQWRGIMILSSNQKEPSTPYTHHHVTIQHLRVWPVRCSVVSKITIILTAGGSQRDVCPGWPIAPSYMSPNAGGGGCGVSANEYSCADGAQINFGDPTPYLTYDLQYYCRTTLL